MTRITITPEGDFLHCEPAIHVEIEDEGAGEFLMVDQPGNTNEYAGKITIDDESWPNIKDAIETLLKEIKAAEDSLPKP